MMVKKLTNKIPACINESYGIANELISLLTWVNFSGETNGK